MKTRSAMVSGLMIGVLASVGLLASAARTAPAARPYGPPIGPALTPDTGAGEMLFVVVGGVFPSRKEAEVANAQRPFGDLQGYYVVPVAQFQGFSQEFGKPGDFALVSAFRTEEGAKGFVDLAATFGYDAVILPDRVLSLGGLYAGLGQEPNPNGTGPLMGPVEESLP